MADMDLTPVILCVDVSREKEVGRFPNTFPFSNSKNFLVLTSEVGMPHLPGAALVLNHGPARTSMSGSLVSKESLNDTGVS